VKGAAVSYHSFPKRALRGLSLWLTLAALALATGLPARAADSVRETSSLALVPEDAAFYWARLRLKEQYDSVVNSKAVARLWAVPVFKKAREHAAQLQKEAGGPDPNELAKLLEQPDVKAAYDLAIDAVSHEVFIYGDAGYADLLEQFTDLSNEMNAIQLEGAKAGGAPDEATRRKIGELLIKHVQRLKVPDTVIGLKLKDPQAAGPQLTKLEAFLAAHLEMQPPEWQGRLSRETISGTKFITLKLDGTLIPWSEIPQGDTPPDKEQFDKMVELVKKMTLVVSIGIRDGYLLVSIGDSSEHLKTLGQGKLLRDRPELAPIGKHAEKPFTSIGYVSQRFLEKGNRADAQLDSYVRMLEQLLPLSEVDPELQKEMIADARSLAADLKKYIPKPGAVMGFSFLSPRGLEGYSYNWGEQLGIDGSQKLSILDHVGGSPLGFAAGRRKYDPAAYEMLAKWLGRGVYYGEQLGLNLLEPEQRALYDRIRTEMTPLVERLDTVTKTMWLPAFKDGQIAIVLDAKLTSKQWQQHMPPAEQPLPMLEFGLVYGVSDAALVKKASGEYFSIAREAMKKLHAIVPEAVPEFDVPLPQSREFPEGTVYYYSLPPEWGVDTQIAPNAALSSEVLALTMIPKFGVRLLKKTPLAVEGPLANHDRPLASAAYFNWAGLVSAVEPWIDYGYAQGAVPEVPAEAEVSPAEVREGTKAVLEFLKCLRTMSSVSYFEEGALVTHSEWHLVDE
jgi:hypothetical protein